jgi:hypothetical protein
VTREQEDQSLITIHRSPSARENVVGAVGAGLIVVAFCLLLLWHDPLLFWNDDYELSILPVFADVARSWSEGHWPLLSPSSWVCGNLAGEFQYGTFSVFVNAAVVLIWKFPLSFPQQAAALSITHLFVLGMGGYLLARGRNLSSPLSIMVALVTALNGWIICWGATDWFGALGAFAWFPWAWWSLERAAASASSRWSKSTHAQDAHATRFLWPAPFVYLLVTGGFPYTVLMLALLVAWLSIKSLVQTRSLMSIVPMLFGVAFGFGLSAPAWLAIFDYVHGSAREAQPAAAHWQWIVPWRALPAFILPGWTVNWADFSGRLLPHTATEMACGLVPPTVLAAGLIARGRALVKPIKWELGLLVIVLFISMLPSVNVFRWSFRWLPFFHLILVLCAAEALQGGIGFQPMSAGRLPGPRYGLAALLLIGVTAVATTLVRTTGTYAFPLAWILLMIAAAWAILEKSPQPGIRAWAPAIVTFLSLLATYLCIPPNCGVPKYNLDQKLTSAAPLDRERIYLGVYPAPELAYRLEEKPEPFGTTLRIGSTSMWGGIHLLNGYSPIRPSGVAREFDFAIHGEIRYELGRSLLEKEGGPDGKLARLGVDGIIIANEFGWDPQPATEWELAAATEEGRVFHRRDGPLARVRSVNAIDSQPGEHFASADVSRIVNGRNRLLADVTVPPNGEPALLTISRPFFNGYRAKIGEVPLKVGSYRGLIPIIEISAGMSGRLTLVYRPWWLICGGAISLGCLGFILLTAVRASAVRPPQAG